MRISNTENCVLLYLVLSMQVAIMRFLLSFLDRDLYDSG